MRELFTTLFVFAAAFMLWRTMRPHRHSGYQVATPSRLPAMDMQDEDQYKWPSLGLFQFNVPDSNRYQSALKLVVDGTPVGATGTRVVAQLHIGSHSPDVWKPVEVRVHGQRVGFLSSGDASRFQRRLAYEGRAGQTTSCDAIIAADQDHHGHYDIRLDLKEFRH
ncbi:hypothetical protein [Rhodoferax sp.]|uniref:hypothetical protein n=1 Tax=Rhodoferax sp. TaxID=50421 RepID=UPI00374D34D3